MESVVRNFCEAPENRLNVLAELITILRPADASDNVTANKNLSNLRAKSVLDQLILSGIEASRLTSIGFGEEKPIATNDTEEGRQLNRRTEFKVLAK